MNKIVCCGVFFIAERLSARQLILHRISYVCTCHASGMQLRFAHALTPRCITAHACYTSHQASFPIAARVQIMTESSESMLERNNRLRKQRQRQRDKEDTGPRFRRQKRPRH